MIRSQIRDLEPFLFHLLHSPQDRIVFHLSGDDMPAFLCVSMADTSDSPVIALCTSGGKEDLCRQSPDAFGNALTALFQHIVCSDAVIVDRRRIPVFLAEIGQHFLKSML